MLTVLDAGPADHRIPRSRTDEKYQTDNKRAPSANFSSAGYQIRQKNAPFDPERPVLASQTNEKLSHGHNLSPVRYSTPVRSSRHPTAQIHRFGHNSINQWTGVRPGPGFARDRDSPGTGIRPGPGFARDRDSPGTGIRPRPGFARDRDSPGTGVVRGVSFPRRWSRGRRP
jgi:hypothetical protein